VAQRASPQILVASGTVEPRFPYLPLTTTAERAGVELRENGHGAPLVFVPGMTGGGQATLYLAARSILAARARGHARRLVVVDYTREAHPSLESLQDTVATLLRRSVGDERCLVWTESLGNLVAPPGPLDHTLNVERRVMLSPFTAIPGVRLALGLLGMTVSPAFLYRMTIGPLGRFFFGPAGDRPQHVFFQALAATSAAVAHRRSAWLRGRNFTDWFFRSSVPTKVWIGALDRLVCRPREAKRFRDLARRRPTFALEIVAGAGHVVTDTTLGERLLHEINDFCREGE
jgi:pimeloyl-ACP methyl ester carboxylesterase